MCGVTKQDFLTVKQVADLEGVSRWTIWRRVRDDEYAGVIELPNGYLIPRKSVKQ